MHKGILIILLFFLSVSCTDKLIFETLTFEKATTLPCKENCPHIKLKIPFAKNKTAVADSINSKIFSVLKSIIYIDNQPFASTDYNDLLASFIGSYEKLQKDYPNDTFGWEGDIQGSIKYQSDKLLNIEIDHYTYTGGAHGYQGLRSLLFDPQTGKIIPNDQLFNDIANFKAFAEKQFRIKYKIPANGSINSTGFQFEEDQFQLPQNIFYTEKGLLLYYNQYEAASYADGPKELFLPYKEAEPYLAIK